MSKNASRSPKHAGFNPRPVLYIAKYEAKTTNRQLRGLPWKRSACWFNKTRNSVVAAVARAALHCDTRVLSKHGVDFISVSDDDWHESRVAVVVESTEHAKELKKLLIGWRILAAIPGNDDVHWDKGAAAIVTLMWMAKNNLGADIVVWAAGGKNKIFGANPDAPHVVIDFEDAFHHHAELDTMVRVEHYKSLGFIRG